MRVGEDFLLRTFERTINGSMTKGNLWVKEFGGGVETLGTLAYVTEMLVQSHEGFIRLFPGMPPGEGARCVGPSRFSLPVFFALQSFRIRLLCPAASPGCGLAEDLW